ncbi:hypothetical protein MNBD_GAMMA12-2219 [hydrothermal vent metagenome]|uniref:Uncharacterized protein n=1 Tax=hydrothermal vent metagenome TaxID=652676 RepID=A0A3B0Y8R0_9ZZZZ
MKMYKFFALALVLFAGQTMADSYYGSHWQIRNDVRNLLNAERDLLSSVSYYGSRYSHVARSLKVLMYRTRRLRKATHRHNGHIMRARMKAVRIKFHHAVGLIRRSHRLHHSGVIASRLQHVRFKVNSLSNSVHAHNSYRRRPRRYYRY